MQFFKNEPLLWSKTHLLAFTWFIPNEELFCKNPSLTEQQNVVIFMKSRNDVLISRKMKLRPPNVSMVSGTENLIEQQKNIIMQITTQKLLNLWTEYVDIFFLNGRERWFAAPPEFEHCGGCGHRAVKCRASGHAPSNVFFIPKTIVTRQSGRAKTRD